MAQWGRDDLSGRLWTSVRRVSLQPCETPHSASTPTALSTASATLAISSCTSQALSRIALRQCDEGYADAPDFKQLAAREALMHITPASPPRPGIPALRLDQSQVRHLLRPRLASLASVSAPLSLLPLRNDKHPKICVCICALQAAPWRRACRPRRHLADCRQCSLSSCKKLICLGRSGARRKGF